MPAPITKHFLPLADGRQIHYRRAGSGPPLIIMHPSPNSSASMINAINAFSDAFTCLAIDTPGYGISDDFVDDPDMLWGYADALAKFLDGLGIEKSFVYGAATGAQIGIQFARKYPARIHAFLLDGNGDFTGDLDIAPGYFQDVTPVRDGSHLIRIWDMCRQLGVFFPWQSMRGADRVNTDVGSPEGIQRAVNDYLRAGPGYKKGYYEAMRVEKWEYTRQVTVPVFMARNESSVLFKYTQALIDKGLPVNFTVLNCDSRTRYPMQLTALKGWIGDRTFPAPKPSPADTSATSRMQNMYVKARGGFLRARANLTGKGRPIVALHDPAGSSLLVEPMLVPWIGKRPVIALDLPGNGESDNVIEPANITSAAYAAIVNDALAGAGIDQSDVIGRYSGGPVAMEMSFAKPSLVKHLALSGIGAYEAAEQKTLLDNYTPSVAPVWDGSHLATAWAMMRDQGLYWPWFNRTRGGIVPSANGIDVATIHLRVTELLKVGDQYQKAYAAMWTYPMRERLPKVAAPTLVCMPAWDPIYAKMAECKAFAPKVGTADLPAKMADWHAVIDPFFAT
ncbi:MAG: alpha/beta fold hydrolase [Alphaproteobacteria bacterium]|nr:alpha/beta fold hydrolase [Alphaproteobacteria bacterium]